jgi:hypothetical protein
MIRMRIVTLGLLVALAALTSARTKSDASGGPQPLRVEVPGGLAAAFFVLHDCPISNRYAAEIRRICETYAGRGVSCRLVYVDRSLTDDAARGHAREYQHGPYPVMVDRDHSLVRATGVTVTPEVAVLDAQGAVRYRGRIDDAYVDWSSRRRVVRDHSLRDALDALLAGRPAPQPRTPAVGCYISSVGHADAPADPRPRV